MNPGNRLRRWGGLVRVGIRRTISRTMGADQRRIQFSVLGVAATIALLVIVTGIGIGLATGTTIYDDDVDYWITPETDGQQSPLVATDSPQFGSVHDTATQIRDTDSVRFASPVLTEIMRVEANGNSEYVLVVGIINDPDLESVAGVKSTNLTQGDPYYANGTYNGTWTGEAVLSRSTSNLLEASSGDQLQIGDNESFHVVGTDDGTGSVGDMPVALVHLSELQQLTGAINHDQADQFIVGANSQSVRNDLTGIYPQSEVLTRGEMTTSATMDSDLSLALALTAFVVAVSVGTLFVLTTSGLEVVADRSQLATMAAMGISMRSQLTLVGIQTVVVTVIGGIIGSLGGLGGIWLVNRIAMRTLTSDPIARSDPRFVPYGIGAALVISLLALPYLLILTRRVSGGVPQ